MKQLCTEFFFFPKGRTAVAEMSSETEERLTSWRNEAVERAAREEHAASALARQAEELKQKSERARQRAAIERRRADELAKRIRAPSNAADLVIAPPNEAERRHLFAKYAASIQPAPPAQPANVRSESVQPTYAQAVSDGTTKPLTEEQKQSLFRKYASLLPPPSAEEREAQRRLMERVRSFHSQSASEFGGFSAPTLWCELEQRM